MSPRHNHILLEGPSPPRFREYFACLYHPITIFFNKLSTLSKMLINLLIVYSLCISDVGCGALFSCQ